MGIRNRLVAATMAAVTVTALVGVTTAATASASPTAAAGPSASAPGGDKSGQPGKPGGGVDSARLAKVAASLHVSVQRLTTALENLKKALSQGASKSAAVQGFAKELGVSVARAEQALQELSGGSAKTPKPGVPEAAVRLLASKLHISVDRARAVFNALAKLTYRPGDIITNPGFVAIAKSLGITPQKLLSVVSDVKKELGGKPVQKPAPSGSPTR